MVKRSLNNLMFVMGTLSLLLGLIGFQLIQVEAVKFDPIPFDRLPIARINSSNGDYKLGADFSIDFGDETVIKKDNDAKSAKSMKFNKDSTSSLELDCDSNDVCGTSLAPIDVRVYLVDRDIRYKQIVENSVPTLELGNNDCGLQSIEDCANFDFYIPYDILVQEYNIVVNMSFDEAEWLFINPVKILK
jgi:hypothetical protein